MSILIKGMEMPESCYGCPLSEHREETDMGARFTYMVDCKKNSFDDGTFEGRRKTRPDWCPLIEVPAPHGRLIDADALKERIAATYYSQDEKDKAPMDDIPWMNGCNTKVKEVCGMIDDAPTIIEAKGEIKDETDFTF